MFHNKFQSESDWQKIEIESFRSEAMMGIEMHKKNFNFSKYAENLYNSLQDCLKENEQMSVELEEMKMIVSEYSKRFGPYEIKRKTQFGNMTDRVVEIDTSGVQEFKFYRDAMDVVVNQKKSKIEVDMVADLSTGKRTLAIKKPLGAKKE